MLTRLERFRASRWAWLEPWYDWGKINTSRLAAKERDFSDESESDVGFFEIQWLGVHFQIEIGRSPPKATAAEIAAEKARIAERAQREECSCA